MNKLNQLIANIHKSPFTTIMGILVAALLTVSHQPSVHNLLLALGVAVWGAIQKEA